MKTAPFLEYILYDVFAEQQSISTRPMMGSHILYYNGRPFALVKDEELYFKGNKQVMDWYVTRKSKRFRVSRPRGLAVNKPEGKDAHLYYFLVPPEVYEDKDLCEEWLEVALDASLQSEK